MKNQNDLIITIVAIVVALIGIGVLYGTKPTLQGSTVPPAVPLAEAEGKAATVRYGNALPGGTTGGAAGRGGAAAGRPGGMAPMGGGMAAPGGPGTVTKGNLKPQGTNL